MTVEVCQTCDIAGCHHIRDRAARPNLTFAPQTYPGDRILLMLGNVQIGAVFSPSRDPAYGGIWHHGFWLGMRGSEWSGGHAKTEQAAKNALLAKARDWLREAGIE